MYPEYIPKIWIAPNLNTFKLSIISKKKKKALCPNSGNPFGHDGLFVLASEVYLSLL